MIVETDYIRDYKYENGTKAGFVSAEIYYVLQEYLKHDLVYSFKDNLKFNKRR